MNIRTLIATATIAWAAGTATAQTPAIVHPALGQTTYSTDSTLRITLLTRYQKYNDREVATVDADINSPKSANIHPNGKKFYINSLEG